MLRSLAVRSLAAVWIVGVLAGAIPAQAQDPDPEGIAFDGVARTGADTRPVRFRFFCSSNDGPNVTGVLSVELDVPEYEQSHTVFDFDPFEGPDAHAGPLTLLRANGTRTKASNRFTAEGSVIPFGSSEAFAFEVTASRREPGPLRKLAAVLRPLLDGTGQLVWLQGSAKPGGAPMNASLGLSRTEAEQLRTGLGPCLKEPRA
jgi:hypothetical protein